MGSRGKTMTNKERIEKLEERIAKLEARGMQVDGLKKAVALLYDHFNLKVTEDPQPPRLKLVPKDAEDKQD